MTQQQKQNIQSKVKEWIMGLFKPGNALQLVLFFILFAKMSYNGTLKAIDFVSSVNANTATCIRLSHEISVVKMDRYADSIRQSQTDLRQDNDIKLIAKQP